MPDWTQRLGPSLAGLALIVTIHNAWTYSGAYRWLAELQLRLPDPGYDVLLTFLVTYLIWLLPVGVVAVGLRVAAGRPALVPLAHASTAPSALERRLENSPVTIALAIVGLGGLGAGAYFAVDAMQLGEHEYVALASIEAGLDDPPRYVTLLAAARFDMVYALESEHSTNVYVPLDSGAGGPVTVFLEVPEHVMNAEGDAMASGSYDGLLYEGALPGVVREAYAGRGVLAPRHYVLRYGVAPTDRRKMALILGVCGAVCSALALAMAWLGRSRGGARPPDAVA